MTDATPARAPKKLSASDKLVRIRDAQLAIVERVEARYKRAQSVAESLYGALINERAELARLELGLPELLRSPYEPVEKDELVEAPPLNGAREADVSADDTPTGAPA